MRQVTAGIVVAVGLIGWVGVSAAWAEDLFPPSYRGTPGSTTQEWDFMTGGIDHGMSAVYPEPDGTSGITHNPYGTAFLILNVAEAPYCQWSPDGVWYDFFMMDIIVPNRPNAGENSFKEIQVQITCFDPSGAGLNGGWVSVEGEPRPFEILPISFETYQFVQSWTIVPNPDQEWVTVYNPAWEMAPFGVSEIVIDTICVPEPATLALVGLGVAGLVARRRRK